MTKIDWDQNGRVFEAGLDRAVLYPDTGPGVPWSGFVSLDEVKSETQETPYYIDGIRFTSVREEGDYNAKLVAFTYPDEFAVYDGYQEYAPGFSYGNQPVYKPFGLTYRTLIGNGIYGLGLGYKIHILFNLSAIPQDHSYATLSSANELVPFTWDISAVPQAVSGFRPTAHVVIDSRKASSLFMFGVEQILYGTDSLTPRLPSLPELFTLYNSGLTRVVDQGNNIFLVEGPDANVYSSGTDSFTINAAGATPVDEDTYRVTDGK